MWLIFIYQKFLSPLKPACCRFVPTCSEYTRRSILHWGYVKGIALSMKRILKCHPFHAGGYDPVPFREDSPSLINERTFTPDS